jgi:LDH2 family malate/lactate/ureidoglycolate dehydrogenase
MTACRVGGQSASVAPLERAMAMADNRTRVDANKLTEFSVRSLAKLGMPDDDARMMATMLVACDLRGVESHGVALLRMFYTRRARQGFINLNPNIKTVAEAPATATIDGDNGFGFIVGRHAMKDALARASETSVGVVTVRNSTHFGAAAYYAMMALDKDMIGITMTNCVASVTAPGSSRPAVGTNPIAVAAPAGKKSPFVLDMATSAAAGGKLEIARRQGQPYPEGWLIDG